jgi:hypothetical protein
MDVLEGALVRVPVTDLRGVRVPNELSVDVAVVLDVRVLIGEAVIVFEELIVRVVLTLAVPVLDAVGVEVVVTVNPFDTVILEVPETLAEPEDVFDGRILDV